MSSKRLFDFIGQPGVYVAGPVGMGMDGTAVFATANTLTLAGLPFAPEDVQWLGTIMVNADGYSEFPAMEHLHTYAAPIVTIGNAAPVFTAASDFLVLYVGQDKSYDTAGYHDVYLRSALNVVNDKVGAEDIPPPEIVAHGKTPCPAGMGNNVNLTGVSSTLKWGVILRIDPLRARPAAGVTEIVGVSFTSAAASIITGAGVTVAGDFMRASALVEGNHCDRILVRVNDPSKLYITSNPVSIDVVWQAI